MARATEIENLDCEANVLAGARKVLQVRLTEVCELRDAALDWSDIKGVHDMRVATRRLRSAVRDFKPYLKHAINNHKLKILNTQIKTLAYALGAVRDLDVQIESLEKLQMQIKDVTETSKEINHLIEERKVGRDVERHALVKALENIDLVKLKETFVDVLKESENRNKEASSYRAASRQIISVSYREVEKLSDALFRPRAAARPHRLRIAAKRLRYALELFAPCFQEGMKHFAKEIAGLQSSLGTLHDCDVWLDEFTARLKRKDRPEDKDKESSHEIFVRLLLHFADERARAFRDSLLLWNEWKRQNFGAHLLSHCHLDNSFETNDSDETEKRDNAFVSKDKTSSFDVKTTETT